MHICIDHGTGHTKPHRYVCVCALLNAVHHIHAQCKLQVLLTQGGCADSSLSSSEIAESRGSIQDLMTRHTGADA